MTPIMLLSWQQFRTFGSILHSIDVLFFCVNQTSFTGRRVIWAFCAFQVGLFVSSLLVENEDIWFIAERDWGPE